MCALKKYISQIVVTNFVNIKFVELERKKTFEICHLKEKNILWLRGVKLTPSLIKHILQVGLQKVKVLQLLSCMSKMTKVLKILKTTVSDKSIFKCYVFALNRQSTLGLKEIWQGKTKETQV